MRILRTITVLAPLCLGACNCGDDPMTPIVPAPPTTSTVAMANVWKVAAPGVTEAFVQDLANVLDVRGAVEDQGEGFVVMGDRMGPPGRRVAEVRTGTVSIGTAPLFASLGGACADLVDNDLDGKIDILDDECEGSMDASELVAGAQDRLSVPRMTIDLDADGTGTVDRLEGVHAQLTLQAGGVVSATVSLAAPGTIALDLPNATASAVMALSVVVSCAGPGCFSDVCTLDLGTVRFDDGAYNQGNGDLALAATFAVGDSITCSGNTNPTDVATALGVPAVGATLSFVAQLDDDFYQIGPVLRVLKVSRSVLLTPMRATTGSTVGVPSESEAETMAGRILAQAGLTPPNPMIVVDSPSGEARVNARTVTFMPRLEVMPGTLGAVRHGHVQVEIGADGIRRLDSRWRPVEPMPVQVPLRDVADAQPQLDAQTAVNDGTNPPLTTQLGYHSGTPEDPWPYFDPVYFAVDASTRLPAAAIGATDFTPVVDTLSPLPGAQIDAAGGTVPLSIGAGFGTPPYSFRWTSESAGPLGEGAAIEARLPNGTQQLTVEVRDARGAGYSLNYDIDVTGSTVQPPGLQQTPIPINRPSTFNTASGLSYIGFPLSNRTAPVIAHANQNGAAVARLYFEQFRYEITVRIAGVNYSLRSDKCVDGNLSGGACHFPRPPFAVAGTSSGVVFFPASSSLSSLVTISNLPGDLDLFFRYRPVRAYAGPTPNFIQRAGPWLARGGTGFARQLGGRAPGFLPNVNWGYKPPAGGISCEKIVDWCLNSPGNDSEGTPYCDIPTTILELHCGTPETLIPIVDFKAWIYTGLIPMGINDFVVTSLIQDTAALDTLGASDGALNRTLQPFWAPSDAFITIDGIAAERAASFVTAPGVRASWDNYHAKKVPGNQIAFPGCNTPLYAFDNNPCAHFHTSWFARPPYPKGQDVNGYLVRKRASELRPRQRPSQLVNGEAFQPRAPYTTQQMFWHESIASSSACDPSGQVDNSARRCKVFVSPVFFTH